MRDPGRGQWTVGVGTRQARRPPLDHGTERAGLDQILAQLEAPPPQPGLDKVRLHDPAVRRLAGRCAGCQLGKPVEGWTYRQLRRYLELAGAYRLGHRPIGPVPVWTAVHGSRRLRRRRIRGRGGGERWPVG